LVLASPARENGGFPSVHILTSHEEGEGEIERKEKKYNVGGRMERGDI
jgi:hypothetical protein